MIKAQRAAERSGAAVEGAAPVAPAPVPEDPRAAVHAVASDWVRAGSVANRDELLGALRAAGYQIKRAGAGYISILSAGDAHPDPRLPHLPKAIRLKGALYGTGFTDRAQALDWLASVELDTRPAASREAALDWCDPEADLALLRALRARKRDFNRSRYGGPGWEPAPFVHSPAATARNRPRSYGASDQAEIAPASPVPLSHASRVKARIWESLYQTALPPDLVDRISFVDGKAREVRFRDGSVVKDHGNRISGKGDSATLARIMALEAKAKGWSGIRLTGGDAFLRASAREALAQGIIPFGRTPEAEAVIAEEWAKIGGPERRKPAAPRPDPRSAPVPRDTPGPGI